MPFEKFERRKYLKYGRDLAEVRFAPELWRQLTDADRADLRRICEEAIRDTYEGLG